MDIFGEFENEEVVTNDWYFRPLNRAENFVAQKGASSRHTRERESVKQIADASRFGLAHSRGRSDQAARTHVAPARRNCMESRFDRAIGKRNPRFEQVFRDFQGPRERIKDRFDERGRASILTGFGFCSLTDLGEPQQDRRLMVNHNREEEIEQSDDEADLSINEIALHAMDNVAMLISELAALAAFKLHDSVDEFRVAAIQKQLRADISEVIASTRSIAALREQLLGVNVKAELAA
jgi:hypothetical protein